jgi:hypothetical protein
VAQAPRVLLIGKKTWVLFSLREAKLRPCGYSQELKGLRRVASEFETRTQARHDELVTEPEQLMQH